MALICRGAHVLVVDDHDAVRGIALMILVHHGCHVFQARTAEQAIEILARGTAVDVVVADIVLPGAASGVDLMRDIAAIWPYIPVLLMSGNVAPNGAARSASRDGYSVLAKPFRPAELIGSIARMLEGAAVRSGAIAGRSSELV
jgi:DNA-binding NtrC family response regulator